MADHAYGIESPPLTADLALASPELAGWVLGSMSSGIVAIDECGALAMLNAGAQRILGCPHGERSEAIGRPCRDVLDSQPTVAQLLLEALDGRGAQSRAELELNGIDDGFESTIGFTLTPIRDSAGSVRGAAMIFRDLAPFERIDEQLRLQERLAALGQMAAGLAHEIRNPLAGMEVIAGLLKRRLVERPDELVLVDQLLGELRSLAKTVTECLEFVRPISPERTAIDPIRLLEAALSTALSRCDFAGRVEFEIDDDVPEVEVDVNQLKAVLIDLIVNAFEAMSGDNAGNEKRLRLGISLLDQAVVVTISDSGPGISFELREKIFYPFFTTKQAGSGVGLANAQKVVASHGGALEVDPRPGSGATFRLRLAPGDAKP